MDAIFAYPLTDMAAMLLDGSGREIANPAEDSIYISDDDMAVVFISPESAEKYPNVSKTYLTLQGRTEQWVFQNLDEASIIVEGVSHVSANISEFVWNRMGIAWSSNAGPKEVESGTKAMQNWLVAYGDIASDKQVEVPKFFASQCFDQ